MENTPRKPNRSTRYCSAPAIVVQRCDQRLLGIDKLFDYCYSAGKYLGVGKQVGLEFRGEQKGVRGRIRCGGRNLP